MPDRDRVCYTKHLYNICTILDQRCIKLCYTNVLRLLGVWVTKELKCLASLARVPDTRLRLLSRAYMYKHDMYSDIISYIFATQKLSTIIYHIRGQNLFLCYVREFQKTYVRG